MFLSRGAAARKTLSDRYPTMKLPETSFKGFLKKNTKKNRTLDRFRSLSRKQKTTETSEQYWNALNGMEADHDFGTQTESVVHDIFDLNMNNLTVRESFCTEPEATAVTLHSLFRKGRYAKSHMTREKHQLQLS